MEKTIKSDAEWRQTLTPEQYAVLRQKGTERAGTGKYYHNHEAGVYLCAGCGAELFSSDARSRVRFGLAELLGARRSGSS